jgi:hypothetical protein
MSRYRRRLLLGSQVAAVKWQQSSAMLSPQCS